MPRPTKRSGCSSGISTTSRSFSSASPAPPTSSYVTSGLSSTCIMLTVGSILGGSGSLISYLAGVTPTRMPSSMSVGLTFSASFTTYLAYWRTFTMYLASSRPALMILVQRATCRKASAFIISSSLRRSHMEGGARPVSLSLTPAGRAMGQAWGVCVCVCVARVRLGEGPRGGGTAARMQVQRTYEVHDLLHLVSDGALQGLDGARVGANAVGLQQLEVPGVQRHRLGRVVLLLLRHGGPQS